MRHDEVAEQGGVIVKIIGVGGAGVNALNAMVKQNMYGMDFIAVDTDSAFLEKSLAKQKILIEEKGSEAIEDTLAPQIYQRAAFDNLHKIETAIGYADLTVVVVGLGGKTGSSLAPFITRIAQEQSNLTVVIVTLPFFYEKRAQTAARGIADLIQLKCCVVVISCDNLNQLNPINSVKSENNLKAADVSLCAAVRGITDCVIRPGLIDFGFADLVGVMGTGIALMSTGSAIGPERANEAVARLLGASAFKGSDLHRATGALVTITAAPGIAMGELADVIACIEQKAGSNVRSSFTCHLDESVNDELQITIVATGISDFVRPYGTVSGRSNT